MRYSAVQEDEYGVGLKQDEVHLINNNNVDESMMAATGEAQPVGEDTAEKSSTVYNLPLLFANGYPTSLETITQPQLEKFITFMVQCSMEQKPMKKPSWWPHEIEFTIPVKRPPGQNVTKWVENLKKLVQRCYNHHRSECLLRFCSSLAQYPREKLRYVNNWNSTTSVFHKSTGRLLATFRDENMNYDKVIDSPLKSLLAQNHVKSNLQNKYKKSLQKKQRQSNSSLVVLQPPQKEIYLCDNCDAEFDTLDQVKDHEKICGELRQKSSVLRPITPAEVEPEVELDQPHFMEYFHLVAADQLAKRSTPPTATTKIVHIEAEGTRSSRRMRPSINLTRHPTIPFSSPAGLAMVKKSKGMTDVTQQERLDRIERYMNAPPLSKSTKPKWYDKVPNTKWAVTFKPNKENVGQDDYVHQYTFGAFKRKPALSLKSQLLYVACRPIYVRIEKLTDKMIQDLRINPWKYQPPTPKITTRRHEQSPRLVMRINNTNMGGDGLKRKYCSNIHEITIIKEKVARRCSSNGEIPHIINNTLSPQHNGRQSNVVAQKAAAAALAAASLTPPPSLPSTPQLPAAADNDKNKTIILVDLCSSDEEDNCTDNGRLSDENRDPLNKYDNSSRINCVRPSVFQPTKRLSNGLGLTNESMNERLRDSILTDDNEKSGNLKYLVNSVLDNCKNYSPIFKPAP